MGVSPRCRVPPPCCITGTTLPPTTVWPFRLGGNGFTCATSCAYSGAARHITTISRNRPSAASAMWLRRSRLAASAHGLRPTTPDCCPAPASTCSSSVAMSLLQQVPAYLGPTARGLREPEPVKEDVPLRVEHVTADVAGQEVDQLRVVQSDPGRRVGVRLVHLGP